jgi:hypothetical protein
MSAVHRYLLQHLFRHVFFQVAGGMFPTEKGIGTRANILCTISQDGILQLAEQRSADGTVTRPAQTSVDCWPIGRDAPADHHDTLDGDAVTKVGVLRFRFLMQIAVLDSVSLCICIFLQYLRGCAEMHAAQYPGEDAVFIIDNARTHKARADGYVAPAAMTKPMLIDRLKELKVQCIQVKRPIMIGLREHLRESFPDKSEQELSEIQQLRELASAQQLQQQAAAAAAPKSASKTKAKAKAAAKSKQKQQTYVSKNKWTTKTFDVDDWVTKGGENGPKREELAQALITQMKLKPEIAKKWQMTKLDVALADIEAKTTSKFSVIFTPPYLPQVQVCRKIFHFPFAFFSGQMHCNICRFLMISCVVCVFRCFFAAY